MSGGTISDTIQIVYNNAGGTYQWVLYDSSGYTTYNETINTDQWYCLEIGYDSVADTQTFYRNGTAIISKNIVTAQTATSFTVGFRQNYAGTGWSAKQATPSGTT